MQFIMTTIAGTSSKKNASFKEIRNLKIIGVGNSYYPIKNESFYKDSFQAVDYQELKKY